MSPIKPLTRNTIIFNTPVGVDWGLVVKLALPGKVTRRAYKVIGIYDRFVTKVQYK
jgi:hypothetical protein